MPGLEKYTVVAEVTSKQYDAWYRTRFLAN